ncbi:hypothetical protein ACWXWU_16430 [Shewanella sp. A14]
MVYSKAVLSGQEKQESGSVTLNGVTINTTIGYITSSPANVAAAIDGSFEVMTNANDPITADWGLFDDPGKTIHIYPKGYDNNGDCSLLYNVDSSQAEPTFYGLTTNGC